MANRGGTLDRLESEKAEFFERVREGYLAAGRDYSDVVSIVNSDRPLNEVHREVLSLIQEKLK